MKDSGSLRDKVLMPYGDQSCEILLEMLVTVDELPYIPLYCCYHHYHHKNFIASIYFYF